jgi:hypothetical protein
MFCKISINKPERKRVRDAGHSEEPHHSVDERRIVPSPLMFGLCSG